MKLPPPLHGWEMSPRDAIGLQRELAGRVVRCGSVDGVRLVAGLDCAFSKRSNACYAAVVVWDIERGAVVETKTAITEIGFPYIPGLLSFREVPALAAALAQLESTPDLLMCDGHGVAHPRRFGLASHLGVFAGVRSVGCAKSRLIGEAGDPGPHAGSRTGLYDGEELIGTVLRTREGVRPIFVSVGTGVTLENAVDVVLACCRRYRLPEPTRLADQLVGSFKGQCESGSGPTQHDGDQQ